MVNVLLQRLKALSDDTRFKIVKLLLCSDLCVGALACKIGISEAAISQHLKILREAELVIGEKRGYWTHYKVKKEALEDVAVKIKSLLSDKSDMKEICSNSKCNGDSRGE